MPQESQIESCKDQDGSYVRYQPFPEPVPEEQEIKSNYDGYHQNSVKRDNHLFFHSNPSSNLSASSPAYKPFIEAQAPKPLVCVTGGFFDVPVLPTPLNRQSAGIRRIPVRCPPPQVGGICRCRTACDSLSKGGIACGFDDSVMPVRNFRSPAGLSWRRAPTSLDEDNIEFSSPAASIQGQPNSCLHSPFNPGL